MIMMIPSSTMLYKIEIVEEQCISESYKTTGRRYLQEEEEKEEEVVVRPQNEKVYKLKNSVRNSESQSRCGVTIWCKRNGSIDIYVWNCTVTDLLSLDRINLQPNSK